MTTSISFNGKRIDTIENIYIEDIDVSPIQLNPVSRQRPIAFGAEFVRMGGGTRNVTITFALLQQNINEREKAMQSLRDILSIGSEKPLKLPQYEDKYLQCAVTQLPDYSYRKWWENKLKIVFTCFDNPYWTSSERIEVRCGTPFSVGGSAPPLMTIEWSVPTTVTNKAYSDGKSTMTFATVPAGDMVIDLNRQTAAVGGTSIMRYYAPDSTWITPKTGANQTITGSGFVKYRERWI